MQSHMLLAKGQDVNNQLAFCFTDSLTDIPNDWFRWYVVGYLVVQVTYGWLLGWLTGQLTLFVQHTGQDTLCQAERAHAIGQIFQC